MRGFGEKGYWIGGLGRVDGKKKGNTQNPTGKKRRGKVYYGF
jgi:hypothetical protein